ncbi:hypothetical protein GA0115253_1011311 [Streptomyces sp. Termitarium-T10T-6]|nr:hypothetical protein [Streptomyces sp. Termitarium-T10T-6]SCD60996.1 hypothetical protein GA0115253_1011311 [Streptomyces sp. Termitarium-T10T-6]
MSARDNLLAAISFNDAANAGSTPDGLVDAHRLAAIAERDAQIIEWLTKKAHEEGTSNKERRTRADVLFRMADKLSRGAVRPPLSKGPDPVIELSKSEQQFLAFALELAADQIASRGDEFDEADEAALEKLRTLTGEVTS